MSAEEYYLLIDGESAGPFSKAQIRQMLESKEITRSTSCAREGDTAWVPVGVIIPLEAREPEVATSSGPVPQPPNGLAVILFLCLLFGMVTIAASWDAPKYRDAFGLALYVACSLVGLVIYFIPSWVAIRRDHRNVKSIIVLDLFLGWTLVGWVLALVWALYEDRPSTS